MAPARSATRPDQREQLLAAAHRLLENSGPQALQARGLTAAVGVSTQAVYTHFGGMPGLYAALVADGFNRLAEGVNAVAETDDPVADFFAQGWAYAEWALTHPQLYRLMFGLSSSGVALHAGLEMTTGDTRGTSAEGQAAALVMMRSLDRVVEAGRVTPVETVVAAGQFLSATHGFVLLQIAGAFGESADGFQVMASLGVNLMVGLGDSRENAEKSLRAALSTRSG